MDPTNPAAFAQWWQKRNAPNERKAVADAVAAGLVARGGGLLFLTDAGKRLCVAPPAEH